MVQIIFLVYGSQGSGKTLYLTKKGLEAYTKGIKVYSNFKLNFPHQLITFNQLINCELNNAIVLIDEASIYGFSSRQSMSKSNIELIKTFIPQIRKNSVYLYATFQRPRQCDIQLRSQSDYALYCTKYVYDQKNHQLKDCIQSAQYEKTISIIIFIDCIQGDTGKEGQFYFFANRFYKYYDIKEIIKLSDQEKINAITKKRQIAIDLDRIDEPKITQDFKRIRPIYSKNELTTKTKRKTKRKAQAKKNKKKKN